MLATAFAVSNPGVELSDSFPVSSAVSETVVGSEDCELTVFDVAVEPERDTELIELRESPSELIVEDSLNGGPIPPASGGTMLTTLTP